MGGRETRKSTVPVLRGTFPVLALPARAAGNSPPATGEATGEASVASGTGWAYGLLEAAPSEFESSSSRAAQAAFSRSCGAASATAKVAGQVSVCPSG